MIGDRNNYQTHRNKTFVVAKLARTQIDESSIDVRSYSPSKPIVLAEVKWPASEFNNLVIKKLTKKPITPQTIRSFVLSYNNDFKSKLSIDEATDMLADLFSYIKGFGIFYLRHKSIKPFNLTCCMNQFSVFGHDAGKYISYIT